MNEKGTNCISFKWNEYSNVVEVRRYDGDKDSERYSTLLLLGSQGNEQYIEIDCPVNLSDVALLDKLTGEYRTKILSCIPQLEYAEVHVTSINDAMNRITVSKTIGVLSVLFALSVGAATNTEIIDGIEWTIALDTNTITLDEEGVGAYGVKPVDKSKVKGKVVVPSVVNGVKVNRICDEAFSWNNELTEVVISEGIDGVGNRAFYECRNIRKVDLAKVKYICAG